LIHDSGYKVGRHWEKIEGHEHKGICSVCGITESMEHILTKCDVPGQTEVWKLASELWSMKTGEELSKPVMGQIMSCAAIKKRDAGTTRLFRILVSESAHLIWRLRNERVIRAKDAASSREIHNRWLKSINNRLNLDCALTNGVKYGKKAIKKELVQKTWRRVLKNEENLPKNWTWETGVLVGIGGVGDEGSLMVSCQAYGVDETGAPHNGYKCDCAFPRVVDKFPLAGF
jgi:ribonuclease HI